jgi:aromatic ring-opening dioxygenase catalytic subunit (LigB family)
MDQLLNLAKEYGIFAALFSGLLIYVLKQNEKREERLHSVIEKFANIIDVKLENLEKTICQFVKK